MSILDRIQRIAKANINWLLDKVEPPEQELESRIKELEETILEGRESASAYGATFRRLERELQDLRNRQATLGTEAEQALKTGNEDIARKALTEKVKLGERISQISPGVEQGRKTYEMLRNNIIKLQEQLKAAKLKMHDLKARKRAAEAQKAFDEQLTKTTGGGFEGPAFERLDDEVLQTEAEVEIHQEMRGDSMTDLELAERSRDMQVDAELQAMKERLEKE
jgi:phage shock protein A